MMLMKKVLLLLIVHMFVVSCFAKTIRKTSSLKYNAWNYAILLEDEMINSKAELDAQINILFAVSYFDEVYNVLRGNASLICTIDFTNNHSQKILLSLPGISKVFDVWINGNQLKNLQGDENFIADVSQFSNQKQALLVLKFRKDFNSLNEIKSTDLMAMIGNFNLFYLSGVFIQRFETKKDPYFKSYLIETHINNLSGKDVDGKLYARFIDKETFQVIHQSDNCAFSHNGDEMIIDVIFPDMGSSLKPGQYITEVELVDKSKNEATVDIMSLKFKNSE